jgi:predicted PurR-regulated permease PerM
MGTFLLFILIIFLVILVLGASFLRGVIQLFTKQPRTDNYRTGSRAYQGGNRQSSYSNPEEHQKVFSKDEGEYIDYEEIKKD